LYSKLNILYALKLWKNLWKTVLVVETVEKTCISDLLIFMYF
jgi:hypothetical protein